jgi:hypothetical protein
MENSNNQHIENRAVIKVNSRLVKRGENISKMKV